MTYKPKKDEWVMAIVNGYLTPARVTYPRYEESLVTVQCCVPSHAGGGECTTDTINKCDIIGPLLKRGDRCYVRESNNAWCPVTFKNYYWGKMSNSWKPSVTESTGLVTDIRRDKPAPEIAGREIHDVYILAKCPKCGKTNRYDPSVVGKETVCHEVPCYCKFIIAKDRVE